MNDIHYLNELKFDFLTNSMGEETGNEIPPINVYDWYCKNCVDNEWLQYLVKINDDEYGILAIIEIAHDDCHDWDEMKDFYKSDWINSSKEEKLNHLKNIVKYISNAIDYEVYLGYKSGVFDRHEVVIFFPHEYLYSNEVKKAFDKIDYISKNIVNVGEFQ